MIIELDELRNVLKPLAHSNDTGTSEALWIKLAPYPKAMTKYEKVVQALDFRTPNGDILVQVDVDEHNAILGIEILP